MVIKRELVRLNEVLHFDVDPEVLDPYDEVEYLGVWVYVGSAGNVHGKGCS